MAEPQTEFFLNSIVVNSNKYLMIRDNFDTNLIFLNTENVNLSSFIALLTQYSTVNHKDDG